MLDLLVETSVLVGFIKLAYHALYETPNDDESFIK
jgi:hypothetical protein